MARERSFRNTVVESGMSLPVMSALTLLLWLIGPRQDVWLWTSLAIVAVTTYVVVEWNNQCQLLRIRSRMNSVSFLALINIFPALHVAGQALIPALCLLATYFTLFKAYGKYRPQGYAFHAFFFLGLGSLVFPPMLLLAPTLLFSSNVQLRITTLKSVTAMLLGLLLPFWLYAAAMTVAVPLWGVEVAQLRYLSDVHLPDLTVFSPWQWGALAFIGMLGLVAVGHFVSTAYNDKIRTRQYYYTMLISFVPLLFATLWWPADFVVTLPLLLLNLTPFVAHYLALSRVRRMPLIFWLWLLIAVAVGAANYLDLWAYLPKQLNLPDLQSLLPANVWKYFTK